MLFRLTLTFATWSLSLSALLISMDLYMARLVFLMRWLKIYTQKLRMRLLTISIWLTILIQVSLFRFGMSPSFLSLQSLINWNLCQSWFQWYHWSLPMKIGCAESIGASKIRLSVILCSWLHSFTLTLPTILLPGRLLIWWACCSKTWAQIRDRKLSKTLWVWNVWGSWRATISDSRRYIGLLRKSVTRFCSTRFYLWVW